jgi:YD repeat-containing protein
MMLKKLISAIAYLILANNVIAQSDYVNVIPPSPTASSIQRFGNTDVSLYTGALKIGIPIHTIKMKDLEFPIALSYSGAGGINIQQIASWVGLGWSLSATSAVSRTIYGLADDKANGRYGYFYTAAIPPLIPENIQHYQNFANGNTDAEPDRYYYNVGSYSGTFYIDKQKQVIQVPLSNNKIIPEFEQGGYKLIAFKIITDRGITYQFTEHEEVRSIPAGGTPTDLSFDISSWYLSSIHNFNNTEAIYFHYDPYEFTQYSESVTNRIIDTPHGSFQPSYVKTETKAKRLKYITYNESDTIEFITGEIPRRDLIDEQFLASIEINEHGRERSVDFAYSYFDQNGEVPITAAYNNSNPYLPGSLTDGDHLKRLKLDAVYFLDDSGLTSLPYYFEYFTESYLPSRFSYARDHWGYYNGQDNNASLEPRNKVDLRPLPQAMRPPNFAIYGSANREASEAHAKAGVLTKITYPTGGWSEYEYELHDSSNKLLPNERQFSSVNLNPVTNLCDTIHIETINDPFSEVITTISGISLSENCDLQIKLKNLSTGIITTLNGFYLNPVGPGYRLTALLEAGDYEITFIEYNGLGNCFEDLYGIDIEWDNELNTPNKKIGGLRVKRSIDYDANGNAITRVYNYTMAGSTLTSGSVVSIPRYGYFEYDAMSNTGEYLGWYRMYNTNIPLALTQGSHVGYRRVEVTTEAPEQTGKSVFYYSCPADYPDIIRGWTLNKYDDEVFNNNGIPEYTYIFPHQDSKDWKRGLLYAQVDYKFENGQFVKIYSKENHYNIYGIWNILGSPPLDWQYFHPAEFYNEEYSSGIFLINEVDSNGEGYPKLQGVRTFQGMVGTEPGWFYIKNYEFFSGRLELISQNEKFFSHQSTVTTNTHFNYGNPQFYYPTKTEITTSQSDTVTTLLKYPFDYASIDGLTASNQNALDSLQRKNFLSEPVEEIILRANAETQRQRTDYNFYGSSVLPKKILTSIDGGTLETEVELLEYDAKGNLLSYKGKDGLDIGILWGYDNKFPTAKAVNALHSELFYESFEETGITGPAKSGKKYHAGNFTVKLTTANPASILSYWYWENNSWHYKEVPYTGGNHLITDGERLDEIRIYPAGARMTTYTYSPGIGFTSVTDHNNQTIHYEYDSFGRLTVVRDHLGNITQDNRYHYVSTQTQEP